jgi:pimeloyl-ACP methyl ester carboxylesterase
MLLSPLGPAKEVAERLQVVAAVLPRTIRGWLRATRRPTKGVPPPAHRSLRQAGEVGLDEFFLAANAVVRRVPTPSELEATVEDSGRVADALRAMDPMDLYPEPSILTDPRVTEGSAFGVRFERLTFPSACVLPPALEARAPWSRLLPNGVAHAVILRHPGPPRPWIVCVHGAGQGRSTDLVSFRVQHLFRNLGLNVALPVLPLHGRRAVRGMQVPGMALPQNVAATVQAVHDIRRLITWIRRQGAPHIAVYGVSLGGHTASLLAGVEPSVDTVIAGVPVTGVARLLAHQLRRIGGRRGRLMSGMLSSEEVLALDRYVDPLAMSAQPSPERRFIFAGLGDAITTPAHAVELWEHWERPRMLWYPGGHVGHVWSGEVRGFVDEALGDLEPAR